MKKSSILFLLMSFVVLTSCNRPQPDMIGVLMTEYGRNGVESFKVVTGAQGILGPGSELYQVPAWEQTGDPTVVKITTKNAGVFTVDPAYTFKPLRDKGAELIYEYRNYAKDTKTFYKSIEANILNKRVTDAYREEAREYTTDSLMNNLASFEKRVEARLAKEFNSKYFELTTLTSGLTPPKSMIDAVEARDKAIQEANTVRNQVETSKMLLEKARIDAETNRVQSSGLTKEVLADKYIEMLQKTTNKVIITDGKTPMILNP